MKNFSKILILLIIFIFSIGVVCAHDLNQTDPSCVDGENEIGIDHKDVLSDSPAKSFKDLNESISDLTISEFNVTDDYLTGWVLYACDGTINVNGGTFNHVAGRIETVDAEGTGTINK